LACASRFLPVCWPDAITPGGRSVGWRRPSHQLAKEPKIIGWIKTAERFVDPDTGQPVDVLYNPGSGERQYLSQESDKKA
jgi:hypothetical protein